MWKATSAFMTRPRESLPAPLTLPSLGAGSCRTHAFVDPRSACASNANIAQEARLLTDEAKRYLGHGKRFQAHGSVHHKAEEWVSFTDTTVVRRACPVRYGWPPPCPR